MLSFIPAFAFILLAYWGFHSFGIFPQDLNQIVFSTHLPSGAIWTPTYGDMFLIAGLIALFFELFKATKSTDTSIADHILSTFVLVFFLVIWLIEPWAGNSYFMILAFMSLLDVIAGFTITVATARRDIDIET